MPANPSLQFAEAVAVIKADDEQLRSTLRKDEAVVTQSVGRMQASFDKLNATTKTTAATAGDASNAMGSLAGTMSLIPVRGAASVAVLASFTIQVRNLIVSTSAANAAITGLGTAVKAFFVPIIKLGSLFVTATTAVAAFAAFLIALPKIIGLIGDKLVEGRAAEALKNMEERAEGVNEALVRQRKLRNEIAALRGADIEAEQIGDPLSRALLLEKRGVERDITLEKTRQSRAIEQATRLGALQHSRIQQRLRAEQGISQALADQQKALTEQTVERVRQKEATIGQFGPQTAGQAKFVLDEALRAARLAERGLFELRREVLSQLERGLITKAFARTQIGALPGEGGLPTAIAGAPGITRLRRVEAFAGAGDTAGLDKTRNQLIKDTNTAIADLTTVVRDAGGFA